MTTFNTTIEFNSYDFKREVIDLVEELLDDRNLTEDKITDLTDRVEEVEDDCNRKLDDLEDRLEKLDDTAYRPVTRAEYDELVESVANIRSILHDAGSRLCY